MLRTGKRTFAGHAVTDDFCWCSGCREFLWCGFGLKVLGLDNWLRLVDLEQLESATGAPPCWHLSAQGQSVVCYFEVDGLLHAPSVFSRREAALLTLGGIFLLVLINVFALSEHLIIQ